MVNKMDNLSMRISKIRGEFCYGNNIEFSEKLNVSKTYTSSICSGSKVPGKEALEKILIAFPSVSRSWLYFGEGTMLREEVSRVEIPVANNGEEDPCSALIAALQARIDEQAATIRTLSIAIAQLTSSEKTRINSRQELDN